MRLLFEIDTKEYKADGTVTRRPSSRGIIVCDGLLTMVYSRKYDYYKFAGGGIEPDETAEQALIREVREEIGQNVLPESIAPFGYVHRVQKGWHEDIFVQDNFYFFCRTDSVNAVQSLDDYEAEEGFTLRYVSAQEVLETNRHHTHGAKEEDIQFPVMLERDNCVIEMVKAEYPLLLR